MSAWQRSDLIIGQVKFKHRTAEEIQVLYDWYLCELYKNVDVKVLEIIHLPLDERFSSSSSG